MLHPKIVHGEGAITSDVIKSECMDEKAVQSSSKIIIIITVSKKKNKERKYLTVRHVQTSVLLKYHYSRSKAFTKSVA